MELASEAEAIGAVARLKLGVELVSRLEEGHPKRSSIALEAMAKRSQRAIGVHPFAQVGEDLFASIRAVKSFELLPFSGLGLADECDDRLRKNCTVAIEALGRDPHVTIL